MGALFRFQQFSIRQEHTALKVGTDAMLLGALADHPHPIHILDIGTGTGVLALMMAQRFSQAQIVGIDNDPESLIDAHFNLASSPWSERVSSELADVFQWEPTQSFDLIISNPPYYEDALLTNRERAVNAKHTVHFSVEALFRHAKDWLNPKGLFWIILPSMNAERWKARAHAEKLYCHHEIIVFGKADKAVRTILAFGQYEQGTTSESLVIRNEDNSYTDAYRRLTAAFHDRPV